MSLRHVRDQLNELRETVQSAKGPTDARERLANRLIELQQRFRNDPELRAASFMEKLVSPHPGDMEEAIEWMKAHGYDSHFVQGLAQFARLLLGSSVLRGESEGPRP